MSSSGASFPGSDRKSRASVSQVGDPAYHRDPAAALLESEQFLKAYFNASQVGLCIFDTHFRYLSINNTLAEMNGMPAEAHLGKSAREMVGRELAELLQPHFERALETAEPVLNIEVGATLTARSEPGHWFVHFIPIKDATSTVTKICGVAVEITQQKNLESYLRGLSGNLERERKHQRILLELSGLLAASLDPLQAFPQISACLRRILRQEFASLTVCDEKSGELESEATDFPLRKRAAEINICTEKSPARKALREKTPLILNKNEMESLRAAPTDYMLSEGLKSLCCIPLLRPSGPLGVLALGSTRNHAFKVDDLSLLNQVAAQLALALENAHAAREIRQLKSRLEREQSYLKGHVPTVPHFEEIVGQSPALRRVLAQVAVVAPSDATVLLLGETGTGKGLFARAIHQASRRKERPFVALNCAAIPTGLLESELFGHEKGAFTGAVSQKIGRLEFADKGTLFLDEIGDIPLELQPKLLRVLQDREFERLGGTRTIKVNLRLIAATNRDLARSVAENEFRSDLFYRLNVFPIRVPSLRERREDIPLLVRYFVRIFARRMFHHIETIPTATMDALVKWPWPGNVRELENFIERSVILTDGTALHAPLSELQGETRVSSSPSLEAAEREHIIRVLRETGGVISGAGGAAKRLGLKRTTLQSKMQRLGITRRNYSGHKS